MRITRLTLAGFGPYKNEQVVDFDRFADDGIFLITGKTGAGKSSILDAICYALYASVPRYEQAQQHLRSDHCGVDDPTFVELEFTVNGTSYRVRRSPEFERPKQRGTGTTKQAATAELSQKVGDEWQGMSARAVDVGRDLDRILGLSKDQFLQVILLAQNRFQKFLKSTNDERQSVLRTLFGTRRFERIESILVERRKALEADLDVVALSLRHRAEQAVALVEQADIGEAGTEGGLGGVGVQGDGDEQTFSDEPAVDTVIPENLAPEWFEQLGNHLSRLLAVATDAATVADAHAATAEVEHRRLVDTRRLQERRAAGELALRALDAQSDAIAIERTLLADAQRAAVVWILISANRGAEAALQAATVREDDARASYATLVEAQSSALSSTQSSDALDTTIDTITRTLGSLADSIADEKRFPALVADIARAAERLAAREREITEAAAQLVSLPAQITALGEAAAEAKVEASRRPDAEAAVTRVGTALRSASLAVSLEGDLAAAETTERQRSATHTTAAVRLDSLLEERLSGHAAELASTLVDGSPCMVCGATEHPEPATNDSEPVTEARIIAARAELTAAREAMDAAHTVTQTVDTRLTEARTRADGKTVTELEHELADSTAALEKAQAAFTRSVTQDAELAHLRATLDDATSALAALTEARTTAQKQLAEAQHTADTVSARIVDHRADFATVAARADHLRTHLAAARLLLAAIGKTDALRVAQSTAQATLTTQLREQNFDSEAEAIAARRPASDVAALDRRIREYDQSVATARATITDPELAGLPEDPVSADAAADTLAAARTARDNALRTSNSLAERVSRLAATTSAALAEMAGTERARREFAQLKQLANAVQGLEPNTKRMRLETFVLAAQLEEIVAAANARLRTMTSGRFVLEHNDGLQYRNTQSGLGLSILDQHTGRSRATHSLSGGETFLASLALALGLAEVVTNQTGGITLDTLFIDEGFGSLDSETLETAMSTLDSLRAGGRTIGLISHVDTMKEQIPAKLRIVVTDRGYSEIEVSVDAG